MNAIRTAIVVVCLALAVTAAAAQTGGLRVQVQDASDSSPLPGAAVTLTSDQGFVPPSTLVTDVDGWALFPVLRPGTGYFVEIFFEGYARVRSAELRVRAGDVEQLIFQLTPEQVEQVKVVATRDVVDLEKTSTSTKFTDEFIQDLPVAGRFYQNMLTMAPGVQDADGDGNPNVLGARSRDFKAVVGGISNQDPLSGQRMNFVNMDSIEEVEIITAGAGVEYGRAQGGFANIIQKQGSNDFEGSLEMIFRTSKLDGNGATDFSGDRIPAFDWYQPSVTFSGPLIKDRLWYRLSHTYMDIENPVNRGAEVAISRRKQTINADQITWQVSPKNKLAFQIQSDPATISNANVSVLTPPESSFALDFGGPTYSLTWTAPYSPSLLVESQIAYQDYEFKLSPSVENLTNSCIFSGPSWIREAQCLDLDRGLRSGSFFRTWEDQRQRLTAKSNGTYYVSKWLGMSHELKFGFEIENERYFLDLYDRPSLTIFFLGEANDPTGEGEGAVERLALVNAAISVPQRVNLRATGTNWAAYVSDQFKPLSNLTFEVGVRLSSEAINADGHEPLDFEAESQAAIDRIIATPADFPNILAQEFTRFESIDDFFRQLGDVIGSPDPVSSGLISPGAVTSTQWLSARRAEDLALRNTNLEPRFAASWDPWNDGKTKLSATWGRYYDKIFLAVPLAEQFPTRTALNFLTTNDRSTGAWNFPEDSLSAINPAANLTVVDRDLRTPYVDEFTFAIERELWTETALKLSYISRHFEDQLQDTDVNKRPGDFGRCRFAFGETPVVASPGTGELVDAYTNEVYMDDDPGIGDGRIDDCAGAWESRDTEGGLQGPSTTLAGVPDGIPDLYLLNPGFGDVYQIGNLNTAKFHGVVVEVVRRQYRNWQMDASYTWSRAIGDAEDYNQLNGDDRSNLDDERGFLSYDQRHVVKVNATTITPWGFRLGTAITWQSGLPFSIIRQELSRDGIPPYYASFDTAEFQTRRRYPTSQRNSERNRPYWNFDVKATKEINLRGGMNLQLSAEVFNLLNDDTLLVYNTGTETGVQLNGVNDGFRRFGRRFQIGARLAF